MRFLTLITLFCLSTSIAFAGEPTHELRVLSITDAERTTLILEDLDLSASDLTKSNLSSITFKNCTFKGAKLSGANLTKTRFERCDLVGADFSATAYKTLLVATTFAGCNLMGSTFNKIEIRGVNFAGNTLAFSDFIDAKLVLNYDPTKGNITTFEKADVRFCDFNGAEIEKDISFSEARLAGSHFNGKDHHFYSRVKSTVKKNMRQSNYAAPTPVKEMTDIGYDAYSLTGSGTEAKAWDQMKILRTSYRTWLLDPEKKIVINAFPTKDEKELKKEEEAKQKEAERRKKEKLPEIQDEKQSHYDFTKLDFGGLDFSGATFIGIEFNNSNFFGLHATGATFTNCTFTGANLILANMENTALKNTLFNNALLYGTSFMGATFKGKGDFSSYFGGVTAAQHAEEIDPKDMGFSDDEEEEEELSASGPLPNPTPELIALNGQIAALMAMDPQNIALLSMVGAVSKIIVKASDLHEEAQKLKTRAETAEKKLQKKKDEEKDGKKDDKNPEILYIGANFMNVQVNGSAFAGDESTTPFKDMGFWEAGDKGKHTKFCSNLRGDFSFFVKDKKGTKKEIKKAYLDDFDGIAHQKPVLIMFQKLKETTAVFEE